jgi:hypothetical protein
MKEVTAVSVVSWFQGDGDLFFKFEKMIVNHFFPFIIDVKDRWFQL